MTKKATIKKINSSALFATECCDRFPGEVVSVESIDDPVTVTLVVVDVDPVVVFVVLVSVDTVVVVVVLVNVDTVVVVVVLVLEVETMSVPSVILIDGLV